MATIGMWNTLNQTLTLIAKTSVNVYYAIPHDQVLVCRSLAKSQTRWLIFAAIYFLLNSFTLVATLSSLRRINQTNITDHAAELMFTLIILTLIGIASGPCCTFTFNTRQVCSTISDLRALQKITKGNQERVAHTHPS